MVISSKIGLNKTPTDAGWWETCHKFSFNEQKENLWTISLTTTSKRILFDHQEIKNEVYCNNPFTPDPLPMQFSTSVQGSLYDFKKE